MLSITFANLSVFKFFKQLWMPVGEVLSQVGCVGSLGLQGSKTCLTDRPRGVRRLALTVRDIAQILPNLASGVFLLNKPRRSGSFTPTCSHASRFLTCSGMLARAQERGGT